MQRHDFLPSDLKMCLQIFNWCDSKYAILKRSYTTNHKQFVHYVLTILCLY